MGAELSPADAAVPFPLPPAPVPLLLAVCPRGETVPLAEDRDDDWSNDSTGGGRAREASRRDRAVSTPNTNRCTRRIWIQVSGIETSSTHPHEPATATINTTTAMRFLLIGQMPRHEPQGRRHGRHGFETRNNNTSHLPLLRNWGRGTHGEALEVSRALPPRS